MCQNASGIIPESFPLREEIVTAMVANLFDDLSVNKTDITDVRCEDDHLAAIGHCRLALVHALGARPEIGVHLGHDREHALRRLVYPDDVALCGKTGARLPG